MPARHCPAIEVLDIRRVGLQDLIGEGEDHIVLLGLEVAECEIRVGGHDDCFEQIGYVVLECPLLEVVLKDEFERHHGLRELLSGSFAIIFSYMLPAQVAALLRDLPLAYELFLR